MTLKLQKTLFTFLSSLLILGFVENEAQGSICPHLKHISCPTTTEVTQHLKNYQNKVTIGHWSSPYDSRADYKGKTAIGISIEAGNFALSCRYHISGAPSLELTNHIDQSNGYRMVDPHDCSPQDSPDLTQCKPLDKSGLTPPYCFFYLPNPKK